MEFSNWYNSMHSCPLQHSVNHAFNVDFDNGHENLSGYIQIKSQSHSPTETQPSKDIEITAPIK